MTDKRGTIRLMGRVSIQQELTQFSECRQTTCTALRYRTRVRPEYLITHNILTSDVDSI